MDAGVFDGTDWSLMGILAGDSWPKGCTYVLFIELPLLASLAKIVVIVLLHAWYTFLVSV